MYRRILIPSLLTCIFSLLLTVTLVQADETSAPVKMSLEQAVSSATEKSPALQKADAYREEMKWKKVEGFAVFLPTLDVAANHFFEKKYQYIDLVFAGGPTSIPQIFPTSGVTITAKWLLFDGLSNANTFRATSHLKDAAESDYNWAQFTLEHDIRLAYSKVVAAKKLKDVSEQNVKTLENHLDQIKKMKAGGISTNYDVLRVEAQLSEAQAEKLLAQDNIQIAQANLGKTIGVEESIDTSGIDLDTPNTESIKNVTFALEEKKRADLNALEDKVTAADLNDSANGAFWVPKVSLGAQYLQYNNISDSISDWQQYRTAWNAGFFLNWDIFAPAQFARAKQEKYKLIQNEKSLRQATLAAPVDFAFWKKRFLYSATLYLAKKDDLERAQETVRLAQAGFRAGVRTTTEVLDAELDLFRARAGIVNAQINCTEAKIKLELASGTNL